MPLPTPHRNLWLVAILTFGIGDVVTTSVGLRHQGVHELHPISERILGVAGPAGMVATKLLLFILAYAAYRASPRDVRIGIPIGLVLLGSLVVVNNLRVIDAAQPH